MHDDPFRLECIVDGAFHLHSAVVCAERDAECLWCGGWACGRFSHDVCIDVFDKAGECFRKMVARGDVSVDAHADRVRHFGASREGGLEFARQPRLFLRLGEESEDRIEVRMRHPVDVRRPFHEFAREGLRADAANVHADLSASLHAVLARALPVSRRDARAGDFDVTARARSMAEETLCDRASADVSGADKKDAFNGSHEI